MPSEANGIIRNYSIVCNDSVLDTVDTPSMTSPDNQGGVQTNVTGLMAFTVYECVVFATTNGGRGPNSNTDIVTTAETGNYKLVDLLNIGYFP